MASDGGSGMRVAPDANRVAAALIRPGGWSWRQLHREDVRFFAPCYLWEELEAHLETYAARSGCSSAELRSRIQALRERVNDVAEGDLLAVADDPLVLASESAGPDDAPYFAALVAADAHFMWTNDDALWRSFRSIAVRLIPD